MFSSFGSNHEGGEWSFEQIYDLIMVYSDVMYLSDYAVGNTPFERFVTQIPKMTEKFSSFSVEQFAMVKDDDGKIKKVQTNQELKAMIDAHNEAVDKLTKEMEKFISTSDKAGISAIQSAILNLFKPSENQKDKLKYERSYNKAAEQALMIKDAQLKTENQKIAFDQRLLKLPNVDYDSIANMKFFLLEPQTRSRYVDLYNSALKKNRAAFARKDFVERVGLERSDLTVIEMLPKENCN